MKKITITLDEKIATWAREQAAKRGVRLSRFVGEILRDKMRHARAYEQTTRKAMATKPLGLMGRRKPYSTREELHERTALSPYELGKEFFERNLRTKPTRDTATHSKRILLSLRGAGRATRSRFGL